MMEEAQEIPKNPEIPKDEEITYGISDAERLLITIFGDIPEKIVIKYDNEEFLTHESFLKGVRLPCAFQDLPHWTQKRLRQRGASDESVSRLLNRVKGIEAERKRQETMQVVYPKLKIPTYESLDEHLQEIWENLQKIDADLLKKVKEDLHIADLERLTPWQAFNFVNNLITELKCYGIPNAKTAGKSEARYFFDLQFSSKEFLAIGSKNYKKSEKEKQVNGVCEHISVMTEMVFLAIKFHQKTDNLVNMHCRVECSDTFYRAGNKDGSRHAWNTWMAQTGDQTKVTSVDNTNRYMQKNGKWTFTHKNLSKFLLRRHVTSKEGFVEREILQKYAIELITKARTEDEMSNNLQIVLNMFQVIGWEEELCEIWERVGLFLKKNLKLLHFDAKLVQYLTKISTTYQKKHNIEKEKYWLQKEKRETIKVHPNKQHFDNFTAYCCHKYIESTKKKKNVTIKANFSSILPVFKIMAKKSAYLFPYITLNTSSRAKINLEEAYLRYLKDKAKLKRYKFEELDEKLFEDRFNVFIETAKWHKTSQHVAIIEELYTNYRHHITQDHKKRLQDLVTG